MKISDTVKLVKYEYKYGKTEWIVSIIMNALVMGCILMSLTISLELSSVCSDYFESSYTAGFEFRANGFTRDDEKWLTDRGFKITNYWDEDKKCEVITENLDNIWIYKFEALFMGKDIWDDDLDKILEVILFGNIIFVSLTVVMCVILINSNTNSFTMKLDERSKYICMLKQLGMPTKTCVGIYTWFFITKAVVALVLACGINAVVINFVNDFMSDKLHINSNFSIIRPEIAVAAFAVTILLMCISFRKIWREKNEI